MQGADNQIVRVKLTSMHLEKSDGGSGAKLIGKCGEDEKLYVYLYGTDVAVFP